MSRNHKLKMLLDILAMMMLAPTQQLANIENINLVRNSEGHYLKV